MSSFQGANLFGSGPHRFALGVQGQSVVANYVIGATPPNGSTAQGLRELDITVRGRLVSSSESGLWTLRDAVVAKLTDPVQTGTLVDQHGRSWTGMSFIEYKEGDRVDRGRVRSVEYTAVFRKFL
jgi:hypothetical protein